MTLAEAKGVYFQYYGQGFQMDREEPLKYESFRQLDLKETVLKTWDEELLDQLFQELWSKPDRVWITHGIILKTIRRGHCDMQQYLQRTIDEMAKMNDLDLFQQTLIIENMAGRTESMKDGGVYVFYRYPKLSKKMNDVMERLIASQRKEQERNKRYEDAVKHYRSAYDKWHSSVQ